MDDCLLHHYLDHAVRNSPRSVAITDGKSSWSYQELGLRANRLAACLNHHGVKPGNRVVIAMNRSLSIVEAIFGVLKSGAIYIPVSPETPAIRRNKIIKNSEPVAFILDAQTMKSWQAEDSGSSLPALLICLDRKASIQQTTGKIIINREEIEAFSHRAKAIKPEPGSDFPAGIYYTSGTTGEPKGVVLTHRNIHEYIKWVIDTIGIEKSDTILWTAPYYFDMSLFDIYGSIRAGARLCLADEKCLLFPPLLVELAESQKVTIWKGVASLLMYLARSGIIAPGRLPTLRKIIFSGEVLPAKYLIQWMKAFPDKIFYNAYGPTEATGISMYYRVNSIPDSPEERIPLGKPCENTEIFLLDENLKPVPEGEPGEIFISGICVAKGYWNDEERTKECFIDNPFNPGKGEIIYRTGDLARLRPDGNYEFLGRKDDQVKYMGYRIELQDIEQALISLPAVQDAGVILVEAESEELSELHAFIETSEENLTAKDLSQGLKKILPAYMIPKKFHFIKRIPRNKNGKIDRRALKDLCGRSQILK